MRNFSFSLLGRVLTQLLVICLSNMCASHQLLVLHALKPNSVCGVYEGTFQVILLMNLVLLMIWCDTKSTFLVHRLIQVYIGVATDQLLKQRFLVWNIMPWSRPNNKIHWANLCHEDSHDMQHDIDYVILTLKFIQHH